MAKKKKKRSVPPERSALITSIRDKLERDPASFPGYIKKLRLPYFRHIEPNTELEFTFPLAALTGANGTGKSSILQALYGCPGGYSVGRFWFSTSIDPIASGQRPSLIYEYEKNGQLHEVLKQRIRQKGDPDYWEPARPVKKYGMTLLPNKGRHPTVKRDVLYLHFKTQLSAFDAAFYGEGIPTSQLRDYLRKKTKFLQKTLTTGKIAAPRGKQQSNAPSLIPTQVVKTVGWILGKNYNEATYVDHKYFGMKWGRTVTFDSSGNRYSDAFAGSGETAVFRLVIELENAKNGTLVLLDEPELSLHPEAQKKLQRYLLQAVLTKGLQLVFSTHSTSMVEGLPDDAVFLLQSEADTGTCRVHSNVPPRLAFGVIGQTLEKIKVLVEDEMAQKLLEAVWNHAMEEIGSTLDIVPVPGGAPAIYDTLARDPGCRYTAILDGDCRPEPQSLQSIEDTLKLSDDVLTTETLDKVILDAIEHQPKFRNSGSSQTGKADQVSAKAVRRDFLIAIKDRTHYLPGSETPEQVIYSESSVVSILSALGIPKKKTLKAIKKVTQTDAKSIIWKLSQSLNVSFHTLRDALLTRWVNNSSDGEDYAAILDVMRRIVSDSND